MITQITGSARPYDKATFATTQNTVVQIKKTIGPYSYSNEDLIGQGQFSNVYLGTDSKDQYAIKVIDRKKLSEMEIYEKLLENEISILKILSLKSILKLYEVIHTPNNIYLITEYCKDGDLYSLIEKHQRIPERNAVRILKHLIKALIYLKEHSIIHRDIKTQNILISDLVPKIADFGFAVAIHKFEPNLQIGTPLYMAPETFYKCDYSYKSDIWALGVVFYEMLIGQLPFDSPTREGLDVKLRRYQKLQKLELPNWVSDDAQDLLANMLQYDKAKRFDISQVANHHLIQKQVLPKQTQ